MSLTSVQPKLLDTVAVRGDLPALGLVTGEVGAVVELLSDTAAEVEFVDSLGQTYGLHTLRFDQLMVLHTKGKPLKAPMQAA